jgi:hypothetical protein
MTKTTLATINNINTIAGGGDSGNYFSVSVSIDADTILQLALSNKKSADKIIDNFVSDLDQWEWLD